MKIETKQNRYAPEQFEIFINDKLLNKDLYKDKGYEFYKATNKIRFIRESIFNKLTDEDTNKRFVYIEYKYKDVKFKDYNKFFAGKFKEYSEVKKIFELIKKRTLDEDYVLNITFNKSKAKQYQDNLNK